MATKPSGQQSVCVSTGEPAAVGRAVPSELTTRPVCAAMRSVQDRAEPVGLHVYGDGAAAADPGPGVGGGVEKTQALGWGAGADPGPRGPVGRARPQGVGRTRPRWGGGQGTEGSGAMAAGNWLCPHRVMGQLFPFPKLIRFHPFGLWTVSCMGYTSTELTGEEAPWCPERQGKAPEERGLGPLRRSEERWGQRGAWGSEAFASGGGVAAGVGDRRGR